MSVTITQFEKARITISAFMLRKADQLQRLHGIGYRDTIDAPNDYPALVAAYRHAKHTNTFLPVWNGCSENTVYTSKGANYALRFWHDMLHCMNGLGFTLQEEITIGLMQTAEVSAYFGPDSIEAKIMYADTVRQSEYASKIDGQFPDDQLQFVRNWVM